MSRVRDMYNAAVARGGSEEEKSAFVSGALWADRHIDSDNIKLICDLYEKHKLSAKYNKNVVDYILEKIEEKYSVCK